MPENFRKLRRPRTLLEGLILRSAHAEDVRQTSHARARVSKHEGTCTWPSSSFETRARPFDFAKPLQLARSSG